MPLGESKHWEVRAALRHFERLTEESTRSGRRSPGAALVAAAKELAENGDFTVKQVADTAGMALQTLYRHLGTKDELILAVIEEALADGAEEVAARSAGCTDPVERLHAIVIESFKLAREASPLRLRFHTRERMRLSENFPREVEEALSPYRELLVAVISEAESAGRLHPRDLQRDADIILHLLLVYTHAVASHALPDDVAEAVWGFCLAALQPTAACDGDETVMNSRALAPWA
jgi:AcrR family transcriptional regulator